MSLDTLFHLVNEAPEPVGPFSHAVESDNWIFITGQMPTIPGDPSAPLAQSIEAQTEQVLDNLERVLAGIGLNFTDVVRVGAYLTNFAHDYDAFNRIYRTRFAGNRLPARTCIGVTALAKGASVEIDLVARRKARTSD